MPSPTLIILIVGGVLSAGVVGEGVLLKRSYEAQGALQASNTALVGTLKKLNDAQKERDKTHQTNEALSDEDLFRDLLK